MYVIEKTQLFFLEYLLNKGIEFFISEPRFFPSSGIYFIYLHSPPSETYIYERVSFVFTLCLHVPGHDYEPFDPGHDKVERVKMGTLCLLAFFGLSFSLAVVSKTSFSFIL